MIGFLHGKPVIDGDQVLVLVNGVGYAVTVGGATLSKLIDRVEVSLYVHTHVREEALDLYGFLTPEERRMFRMLLEVSGVGPKTAVGIVDLGAEQVIRSVQTADVTALSRVPRVGKKLAQKIIIELKSKLGSLQELYLGPRTAVEKDVYEALLQLGFTESAIQQVWPNLSWEGAETGSLIKQAMQLLSKK